MQLDAQSVLTQSIGKWYGILDSLGIDVNPDPKKHSACPICGPGNNNHRFRFDDKEGRGNWICTQCGAGDGLSLIQRVLGIDFPETLRRISEIVGTVEIEQPKDDKPDQEKRRKYLNELWTSSLKLTGKNQVTDYLLSRGLLSNINDVRYCKKCYNKEKNTAMGAMVALFRNQYGKPVAIQRTYLVGNSKADLKSVKMTISIPGRRMAGGAVRLYKHKDILGIAEGIETAISAAQLFEVPVWATLSNTLLESWVPPDDARKIIIFGDNDSNFCGQGSAFKLAHKLHTRFNRIVEVQIPDLKDWNDILTHQTKQ